MSSNPLGFRWYPLRPLVAIGCAVLLLAGPQPGLAIQQPEPTSPQALNLTVLQGDHATHLVGYNRQEQIIVEVRIAGVPAKGVNVKFEAPETGPGGYFGESANKVYRAKTDKRGRASTRGFLPNRETGRYLVRVTAVQEALSAQVDVSKENAPSPVVKAENRKLLRDSLHGAILVVSVLVVVALIAAAVGVRS